MSMEVIRRQGYIRRKKKPREVGRSNLIIVSKEPRHQGKLLEPYPVRTKAITISSRREGIWAKPLTVTRNGKKRKHRNPDPSDCGLHQPVKERPEQKAKLCADDQLRLAKGDFNTGRD